MDFKKNEFKNYLLKFENIEIIYKSPKQHWGIIDKGLKKRIGISVFNAFLKTKKNNNSYYELILITFY